MTPKAIIVLAFASLSFLTGAVTQYYWPGVIQSPVDWLYVVGGAILGFTWYRIDSRQRTYKTSPWLDIGVFGIALFALPYYFFRSRGAKAGMIATLLFLLAVLASAIISLAGQYATYYSLQA